MLFGETKLEKSHGRNELCKLYQRSEEYVQFIHWR